MREVPSGYHLEWRVDKSWDIGGDGRRCRRMQSLKRCGKPAVASLKRSTSDSRAVSGFRRWYYCADHLYGRRIQNGAVEVECLVENKTAVPA